MDKNSCNALTQTLTFGDPYTFQHALTQLQYLERSDIEVAYICEQDRAKYSITVTGAGLNTLAVSQLLFRLENNTYFDKGGIGVR